MSKDADQAVEAPRADRPIPTMGAADAPDVIRDARSLGAPKMLLFGLQHMFAMFGATILVPVLTGLSVSATLLRNRWPSCQSPVPASSANSSPLSPRPEEEDVQKGITVFPVKSLALMKLSTGQAAMPHQMG